ncbi:MAG: glycosyltransferase family 39 protein [Anaerolineae bacterium]|nr:glycosyltransferase family 39 protein [Thermoflexales bacterium]MDW8053362.1 glycosyltransferase family 39 protein [Anaerolineae bacterium]
MNAWRLLVVLALYAALGVSFAMQVPAWQNPDEPAHYNYTRQLAAGIVPVIEPSDWEPTFVPIPPRERNVPVARLTYEDHQPPLFYALSLPVFLLSNGDLGALRLFTLFIGALSLVCAHQVVHLIFPTRPWIAAFAVAIVGLLPQHLFVLSGYNNDALAELWIALTAWQAVRLLRAESSPAPKALVGLGVVVGLAFWTKATAYLALPLALLGAWFAEASSWRQRVWRVLQVGLIACLIGLPWWVRNVMVYGGLDFLGLQAHNAAVLGQPTTAAWIAQHGFAEVLWRGLRTTFQSFWGQFGWMSIPLSERWYLLLLALSSLSAAAFAMWWAQEGVRLEAAQRRALNALAGLTLFTVLAFAWYNLQFVQHQGRYLFPALLPIGLAVALGWSHVLRRWRALAQRAWLGATLGLGAFDAYLLWRVIVPEMT